MHYRVEVVLKRLCNTDIAFSFVVHNEVYLFRICVLSSKARQLVCLNFRKLAGPSTAQFNKGMFTFLPTKLISLIFGGLMANIKRFPDVLTINLIASVAY